MRNNKYHTITRRAALKQAAIGCLGVALPPALLAQSALATSPLRGNVHLISGAGVNVVVAVGEEAVLVVDGGDESRSQELLQAIDSLAPGKPVQALFNTNWRPDHCGLNYPLGEQGTAIIAHENTRLWQTNDFFVTWEARHYAPMPPAARANQTFYRSGAMAFGDDTVEYGWISQCHTDGDIYIRFVNQNILVTGDMVTVGTYPLLDYVTGGWISGAQQTTAGLLSLADDETLVVPAVGAVQRRDTLVAQQQMLDVAYDKVAEAYRTGRSLDQFLAAAPMAEFEPVYGNADLFVRLLYRGTWYHVPGRAIQGII